jgi:hypothetical protein
MADRNQVAQALLSSYTPSWREKIGNSIYDVAKALMPSTANRMRDEAMMAVDFIPGVGEAVGLNDAYNDFNAGNYGIAAAGLGATAAGVVPGVGDAVGKGIRVWTGGVGDPLKAAVDKGAWFSEAEDLAREYAGQIGSITPATIRPINPIEFRHAEQSRTIGDIISTALEGNIRTENLDASIPLVESLRAKYGDTSMPLFEYWNNDKEVSDLFRTLGYDSISAAEKSNMAAKTWGALDPSIFSMD